MTLPIGGKGGVRQQFEAGRRATLQTVGQSVGLWVTLAAFRFVTGFWGPSLIAEYSAVVWGVGFLPVMWLGALHGAVGVWGTTGGLLVTVGIIEIGLLEAGSTPVAVLAGVLGTTVVASAGTTRLVERFQRQVRQTLQTALEDPDTGLLSPRGLEIVLNREVGEARRGETLSIVLLALAGYERLADRGTERKQVLSEVGKALTTNSRAMDTVGRLEKNRFLAVLPETGSQGASTFAERVCTKLASIAVSTDGGAIVDSGVQARAGIALWSAEGTDDQESLLARAEEALQLALSGEHGRVVDERHARSHKSDGRVQPDTNS